MTSFGYILRCPFTLLHLLPTDQGSEDCLWTHIFPFSYDYCLIFFFFISRCKQSKIKIFYVTLQFVKETKLTQYKTQNGESNYLDHKLFVNFY